MTGQDSFNRVLANLFPIGVLVLDQDRKVICANRYCEELVNDVMNSGDVGSRIGNAPLSAFVEKIFSVAKPPQYAPHFNSFQINVGRKPLEVAVIKQATGNTQTEHDLDAQTILLIQDANRYKPFCEHRLREAYDLTAAEASITIAIVQGKNVEEIARERSIQTNTVRAHLKQIFSKIGVHRQSELVWRLSNNWLLHVDAQFL